MSVFFAWLFAATTCLFFLLFRAALSLWKDERNKRIFLEQKQENKLPDKIELFDNPTAYLLAQRLNERDAYLVKADKIIKEQGQQIKDFEQYVAKTATCLANFGDIPDKWNDGSVLHRAIRESIQRAHQSFIRNP